MCYSSSSMAAAAAAAAAQAPLIYRQRAIEAFRKEGLSGELMEVLPDRFLHKLATNTPVTVLLYEDACSKKYAADIDRKLLDTVIERQLVYTESRRALTFPERVYVRKVRSVGFWG